MMRVWLLSLLLFAPPCLAATMDFQVSSFSDQVVLQAAAGQTDHLVRFYHVPDRWPGLARMAERAELARQLGKVFQVFGRPLHPDRIEGTTDAEVVWVEGLDAEYWQERSRYSQLVYQVEYDQLGPGWIIIRVINYDHRLQLRAIGFALRPGGLTEMVRQALFAGPEREK